MGALPGSSTTPANIREPSVDRSPDTSDLEQSSSPGSATEYYSGSSSRSESIVNVRFEHREDENGNHVIVGREGILQRCEDEPIRTPGSVQAFGVLIAVEEKDDALVVRQVSENSTEVLGLPPRFLFSLRCFTEILSDPQAELLWDKIQDLSDLENEEDDGVQVFSLTGWGAPGTACLESDNRCRPWTCWCAIHRPSTTNDASSPTSDLIIMEFECERDTLNPLYPPGFAEKPTAPPSSVSSLTSPGESVDSSFDREMLETKHDTSGASSATLGESTNNHGLEGDEGWTPSAADILESTTSHSKPLSALERLRRAKIPGVDEDRPNLVPSRKRSLRKRARIDDGNIGMMDVFAIMSQINEQLGSVESLDMFLKVVVGIVKDLSQFHRVMVYQFDEGWNGQVVAELVDWNQTQDLYQGLHFPASDIPAQARALYAINKVRLLYNRLQSTARIVVRSEKDLETPLNMTHCYLRAMSPIHIKYLGNMGVRASMSISIMAFDKLWGLITCHSYGTHGMRVSFPVRQMLRLLSQSISRNIERLSYAQRLHTRKVIHHIASNRQPASAVYIVSNTEDLLGLFEADFGILVIGEGAKILGPNEHGQEILVMAEYLRLKQFDTILASQSITKDFSDLQVTAGFHTISGLLLVPLSMEGTDFIAFLRKGQPREVRWAGKPYKDGREATSTLEPRKSFKTWTEVVAGRSRVWSEEQLETAGVLALVYGKFIEVWRQKERALQTTKLTELLLSNASHEVRTPLNHIINYLEMALDGPLDNEARENLSRSHTASKSLLFTINDLLDLTRLETGKETYFNEPFNLPHIIETATHFYRKEAERRDIAFHLDLAQSPRMVVGDATKVRTVVENLTANSLQYTMKGSITVSCMPFSEPQGLRSPHPTAVDIVVADTGGGIPPAKLEHIFREFEQVECSEPPVAGASGVGLGLAVVARIVEQLGGRLRVDSKVDHGSRFSFLIPLVLSTGPVSPPISIISTGYGDAVARFAHPRRLSATIPGQAIDHVGVTVRCGSAAPTASPKPSSLLEEPLRVFQFRNGSEKSIEHPLLEAKNGIPPETLQSCPTYSHMSPATVVPTAEHPHLRILVVEDNDINRKILAKRLVLDGHTVVSTTNGQEGLDKVKCDRAFDAVLMDIQMPILNGFDSTRKIREFEKSSAQPPQPRLSHHLNGRIPIFAVSASLLERQCDELIGYGMDGWILKPIDFRRLGAILKGVTDRSQRQHHCYKKGCSWEGGGWLPE
ncbi:GAF domain-like protein [Lyophyllum atratum]|nr:GAF domain-like protein [Lyophyllum atratum]